MESTIIFTVRTHGELSAMKTEVIFTVRNDSQWPYWNKALGLADKRHCLPARHACGPMP